MDEKRQKRYTKIHQGGMCHERKIKQVIKRTDRNICFLYPVWDLSGIYACRYSESAMQSSIWTGIDRSRSEHIFLFAAEKDKATILDLFSGVIVFVIGLFLFTNPQIVVKLLPLMLGALVLVDSIWTLRGSMKLKKRTQETWKFLLIESLVFVGLGVFLMMYNFQSINGMLMFAGWAFLVDGILDVVSFVMLKKGLSGEVQTAADETPEKHAEKEPDTKAEEAAEEAAEEKEIIPEWNSRAASVSTEVIPPEDVTVEDTQEISEAETKEENPESDHLEEQEQN